MVNGLLTHVLSEMKVQVKTEATFGAMTNIQVSEAISSDQKIRVERDEYN